MTKAYRPPRAAYIHVPFCRHRCGYCNFTLVAGRDDLIQAYLTALERELAAQQSPHEVDTIFLGGGTPTHLDQEPLGRLLKLVGERFPLAPGGEFSVEANPIDVNPEKARLLAGAGVTRISIGAQSFDAQKLRVLERDHAAEHIATAVRNARSAGCSVAIDLIFGVPGETTAIWSNDLDQAVDLAPQHISTYGLTWEKGAAFWSRRRRGELVAVSEEEDCRAYELAIDRLPSLGFAQYEVSNFARSGHRCRHNEAYWDGQSYFAAGPGAARFVNGRREVNHRSVTTWLAKVLRGESAVAESEFLAPEDAARERLVFGLRKMEGVDRESFQQETGFEIEQLGGESLRRFVDQQLLQWNGKLLALTRRGLLVSDGLWPDFLRR